MMRRSSSVVALLIGLALTAEVHAADTAQESFQKALVAIDKDDSKQAVELLSAAIKADVNLAEAYYHRGREQFRLGKVDESLADFDAFAKQRPNRERELWERGISQYYAGKFAEGAKQFELYQTYLDNDVENSTWRFLCVARREGIEKARATLLPIRDDRRVPMMKIYAMYQGKATPDDVLAAAKEGKPNETEAKARLFYAYLYIGLFHEAAGKHDAAREAINLAADKYRISHYMGDVARVHAARLKAKK